MSQDQFEPTTAGPHQPAQTDRPRSLARLVADARNSMVAPEISGYTDRVDIIIRIAEQLCEAHAKGAVHGALTAEAVQLSPFGSIQIAGWNGTGKADPAYSSPAQVRGEAAGQTDDIFALGVLMWELLTLRPPLLVESNLTRFWRRKKAGEMDPLPGALKNRVPHELLLAAKRALEPDPARRWQTVADFLAALRDWQHCLESVAVTMQAEQALDQESPGTTDAAAGFRSALQLWPGNQVARDGVAAINAVQALDALQEGDTARAAPFMQDAGPAQQAIDAQFARIQQRQRRRARVFRVAAISAILLLAAGISGALLLRDVRGKVWRDVVAWRPVAGTALDGVTLTHTDVNRAKPLPLPTGDGFVLTNSHTLWLDRVDARGDVRLTVDVVWPDRIDGIEMMLQVPRMNPPTYWMTPPGYTCQFAGFKGTQTFISASATAGWPRRPSPVATTFECGRTYALTFEKRGDMLRLLVDGDEIYRLRSVVPIGDSRSRWLAIRSWCDARITRILVEKPFMPPVSGPLLAADALAANGHYEDALLAYSDLMRREDIGPASDQALAKAHLMACQLPERAPMRRDLFSQASRQLSKSPLVLDVLQAEAICRWQARDWSGALELIRRVQHERPQERCALTLLEQRLPGMPKDVLEHLFLLIKEGPEISYLDLSNLGLTSIQPLQGMQLSSLDLSKNAIEDLSPLAGMPLRNLEIMENRVGDLRPLRGMPLTRLQASSNRITDLSPLAGLALTELWIDGNQVGDLAPLKGMPLTFLRAFGNPIVDVSPLAGAEHLTELHLSDALVTDISVLAMPSLTNLSLARCPVSDISPLARTSLVLANLTGSKVSDPSPLPRKTLRRLLLADCPVTDLAGLAGLSLSDLDLSGSQVTSIDGLRNLTLLPDATVRFSRTGVSDLRPLSGGERLTGLWLSRTQVSDLTPLNGMSIGQLMLEHIPATDLEPVSTIVGLRSLGLWGSTAPSADLDTLADRLEAKSAPAAITTCLRAQAAFRNHDRRRLQAMARPVGKRDRFYLRVDMPIAEARSLAAAAGARLPCPLDQDDLNLLRSEPDIGRFWVGLTAADDGSRLPAWDDGRVSSDIERWIKDGPDAMRARGYYLLSLGVADRFLVPSTSVGDSASVVLEW